MFVNASSTFVESNADVSINAKLFLSLITQTKNTSDNSDKHLATIFLFSQVPAPMLSQKVPRSVNLQIFL